MIDGISFINHNLIWPIIGGAGLLAAIFVWKEWSLFRKNRFILRLFAVLIAIVSLILIALKPQFAADDNSRTGVLLTEGYLPSQLDSLQKAYRNLKLITYSPGISLGSALDSVNSLIVTGHGLQSFDLWQLDNISAVYLAGISPGGIVRLKYDLKHSVGNDLIIKGLYNRPHNSNQLILRGPGGGGLDSISLSDKEQHDFKLKTNLKVKGRFVYTLVEKDTLDKILNEEPLPVQVSGKGVLKVLMINGFPTFESKYLKNFLAEQGHNVLVRSQITRSRYKFEYFNMERSPIYSLSASNLESFDLLIIDTKSYKNLSRNSKLALVNAVKDQGLGFFLQPNTEFFRASDTFLDFDFLGNKNLRTTLVERPATTLEQYPYSFKEEVALQTAYRSVDGIAAAYRRTGAGRVGTTILRNTYELQLEGHTALYQEIWTDIISKMSKRTTPLAQWETNNTVMYPDQPYDFNLRTTVPEPEVRTAEGHRIPLMRDVDIQDLWRGTTHPAQAGWNRQILSSDSTIVHDYYVVDNSRWRSISEWKTIEANKRYFHKASISDGKRKKLEPIPPYWFFLAFLLSAGFLWLEPKLGGIH